LLEGVDDLFEVGSEDVSLSGVEGRVHDLVLIGELDVDAICQKKGRGKVSLSD
jgi:hypothetical protein